MSESATRTVACPHCGAPSRFTPQNRWRPFCSERCRLIDLGDWANERYRVPDTRGADDPDSRDEST